MSATAIVLGAYALVAAPVAIHWLTGRGGAIVASICILLGLAVLANLILSASDVPEVRLVPAQASTAAAAAGSSAGKAADGASSQCTQLVGALRSANVILDTSNPPQVVVNGTLWQQIPAGQRGAVATCIGQALPAGFGKPTIVER